MPSFLPIDDSLIQIADVSLPSGRERSISDAIVSFDVSLTMDGSSEITFEVIDPDFSFANANYFQVRRDVLYQELIFEISVVEVQRSDSIHPLYRISARNKNIQMMKRDKSPEAYRGASGSDFARVVASKFGLDSVVEETTKKQSIVKARNGQQDESVWDVVSRSASDAQFVCFEVDNILFFCSQQFLLGKWGDPQYSFGSATFIPFVYPEPSESVFPGAARKYLLLEMPQVRRSDDDPMEAEGTLIVERTNGRKLRPGMTIWLGGIPDFEGFYLITAVEFSEGVPDPVRVSFRSPIEPEKVQQGATNSMGSGQTSGTGEQPQSSRTLPKNIATLIREYVNKNTKRINGETPDRFTDRIWRYSSEAIRFAESLWSKGLPSQQQEALNLWASTFTQGRNDVRWKAVNAQMSKLAQNTYNPQGLPKSIYDQMFAFVSTKLNFSGASQVNQVLNPAAKIAYQIYKATSKDSQDKIFAQAKTDYGGLSPVYLTLEFARPLITKPNTTQQRTLDNAFFKPTSIPDQRRTSRATIRLS